MAKRKLKSLKLEQYNLGAFGEILLTPRANLPIAERTLRKSARQIYGKDLKFSKQEIRQIQKLFGMEHVNTSHLSNAINSAGKEKRMQFAKSLIMGTTAGELHTFRGSKGQKPLEGKLTLNVQSTKKGDRFRIQLSSIADKPKKMPGLARSHKFTPGVQGYKYVNLMEERKAFGRDTGVVHTAYTTDTAGMEFELYSNYQQKSINLKAAQSMIRNLEKLGRPLSKATKQKILNEAGDYAAATYEKELTKRLGKKEAAAKSVSQQKKLAQMRKRFSDLDRLGFSTVKGTLSKTIGKGAAQQAIDNMDEVEASGERATDTNISMWLQSIFSFEGFDPAELLIMENNEVATWFSNMVKRVEGYQGRSGRAMTGSAITAGILKNMAKEFNRKGVHLGVYLYNLMQRTVNIKRED